MSLVSSFIASHLLSLLETEFVNNEPAIQAAIVSEMQSFVATASTWVESKLHSAAAPVAASNVTPGATS